MNENEMWSSENIQNEISNMKEVLKDITLGKTINFLLTKQIFSKISLTDRIYIKVDEILTSFQNSQNKDKFSLLIIYFMLLLMVVKDSEIKTFDNIDINSLNDRVNNKALNIVNHVLEKNRKYGNSALNPIRIISSADKMEQLYVRLDDKLNRVINRQDDEDEDLPFDIAGYFILIYVCLKLQSNK